VRQRMRTHGPRAPGRSARRGLVREVSALRISRVLRR
jgi:hypothetical protein